MFMDEVQITVKSGKGGDGVVHFRREKYEPRGGPDGGDGGKGGDVYIQVQRTLNTLSNFRHQTHFHAGNGSNGAKQNMSGRSGEDLILYVPPGTLVYDVRSNELIGDLTQADQVMLVAKGGRGGRGNARFASSRDQAPRKAERGEPAQEKTLRLELKLIADIGIVGVPNAGKSTFLSKVTHARPKIAPYPFTTLEPNLGVAEIDPERNVVLADIPGLIEGAHEGVGLGHDFLRHIQRTKVLIHILNGLSEDPVADFSQINSELALFDPELSRKPQVVAFNKIDMAEVRDQWMKIKAHLQRRGGVESENLFAISAITGESVREALERAVQLLDVFQSIETTDQIPVYRLESDPRQFILQRTSDGWNIKGEAIERAAAMTYWEYDASIRHFQKILKTLGIEDALRRAGVREGDTVHIGEYDLEWSD